MIAVDTGGTKTLVGRFSNRGALEESIKFATPTSSDEYIASLVRSIASLSDGKIPSCISIALPGATDSGIIAEFANLPWKNLDVRYTLGPQFPGCTILVANDAKLGGLGEVRGMNTLPHRALYVTVSTGIGVGLIIDGTISHDLMSAEAGHMLLEHDGVMKTWESFASGRAIHEIYGKYGSEITSKRTWRQVAERISRGLFALIPVIKPDVVIIGGSMGTHFMHYGETLDDIIRNHLSPLIADPKIIQATHPEEAVLYGCYYYALNEKAI